jgi:hypothetical protein
MNAREELKEKIDEPVSIHLSTGYRFNTSSMLPAGPEKVTSFVSVAILNLMHIHSETRKL